MPRTADPNYYLDRLQTKIDQSEERFLHIASAINETPEGYSIWPSICEDTAFRLGVTWEVFHGEWAVAAISRHPTKFRGHMIQKIHKGINDSWTRKALKALNPDAFTVPSHPSILQIRKMLDPEGGNITFANNSDWIKWAERFLEEECLTAANRLANDTEATSFLHYLKKMRNALAHSSDQSMGEFNKAVKKRAENGRTGLTGQRNSRLWREGSNGYQVIGTHLTHRPSGELNSRIFAFHERLKETSEILRIA